MMYWNIQTTQNCISYNSVKIYTVYIILKWVIPHIVYFYFWYWFLLTNDVFVHRRTAKFYHLNIYVISSDGEALKLSIQ